MAQPIIIWLRNDLRLLDNELFQLAQKTDAPVAPVFCFDPRQFAETEYGFPKTDWQRAEFLIESVADLRRQLRERGADLIVRHGRPEQVLPELAAKISARRILFQEEVSPEEVAAEDALEQALAGSGVSLESIWGSTLFHHDDLPIAIDDLPDIFTQFRKLVEKKASVRSLFDIPDKLRPAEGIDDPGKLPDLATLGVDKPDFAPDDRAAIRFKGGETEALARLDHYLWESDAIASYKETRNGLLGADYSSKFSAWLACGCLSPRTIYHEVKDYEAERTANSSTYWMIFELIWRDYFRFVGMKFGKKLFLPGGIRNERGDWRRDLGLFEKWKAGRTGVPFIDANMIELYRTGFMSNRGRQNAASFLVKDLKIDWRMGAAWFESQLVDYDPCSNYGNWNYVAGIGNDPRENRYFNVLSQASRYDTEAEYVKHWIPALEPLPEKKAHQPDLLSEQEQRRYGFQLGDDYPRPAFDVKSWKARERRRDKEPQGGRSQRGKRRR